MASARAPRCGSGRGGVAGPDAPGDARRARQGDAFGACASVAAMQRYDPRTALIVVDVQNDFADPKGSLSVAGGEATDPRREPRGVGGDPGRRVRRLHPGLAPGAHAALRQGRRDLAGPLRRRGVGRRRSIRPWRSWARASARARTARTATPASRCAIRSPAPRSPTELDALLRVRGIERVVVCGLATDYCVKATALDAVRLGLRDDGPRSTRSRPWTSQPGDGERALDELRAAGAALDAV